MNELAKEIVGGWTLLAAQMQFEDGTAIDMHGPKPSGSVVFTDKRMSAIITHRSRPARTNDNLGDLFKTMLAYAGTYGIEGNELVTAVDAAWVPEWVGTTQRRAIEIAGDTLLIRTAKQPNPMQQGKIMTGVLTWQRDR
ncbi:MAG: lipocalin-like domain-containing protein [Pseudolabrys sp.]